MDDKNTCLAKDFLAFLDREFDETNRPVCFFENQQEDYTNLTSPWVMFSSDVFDRIGTTIGEHRRYLRIGMIKISVNVPLGTKTAVINEITNKVVEHYEGKRISGVDIDEILVDRDLRQTDSAWFRKIIRISYRYYTVK